MRRASQPAKLQQGGALHVFYDHARAACQRVFLGGLVCVCAGRIADGISSAAPQATNSPVNPDGSIPLDTVSVTATMTQQPVIDAMGGVSSVTEDKIKTFQAQNFNEVLQDVPGVTMQMSPSDPGAIDQYSRLAGLWVC